VDFTVIPRTRLRFSKLGVVVTTGQFNLTDDVDFVELFQGK
jgi:hypothetical protein